MFPYLRYSLFTALLFSFSAHAQGLLDNAHSPYTLQHNLPLNAIRWKPGFWGDKAAACSQSMIPAMRQFYMDRALENFAIAAGADTGHFEGSWWHDGDFYKWVEALVMSYQRTQNPAELQEINQIIRTIQKAQAPDGYINTAIQIGHGFMTSGFSNARAFSGKQRWENDQAHEIYNLGHLFTLAALHYRVIGDTSLLHIAERAASYLDAFFAQPTPAKANLIFNPSQLMGLMELYRSTGNRLYLDLTARFIRMKGTSTDRKLQSQENVPVKDIREAQGHAVTGLYLYCGLADYYAETGDTSLLPVLHSLAEDIRGSKMYITGGVGSYHHGAIRNQPIQEAFGKSFDLPNATAYSETCANIANAMFYWRMLELTGDAHYGDVVETVFYNSMLSGLALDGAHYFYTNPLRWYGKEHELLSQDAYQRWNLPRGGICCPPNVIRTISEMSNYLYTSDGQGLYVQLYGSNKLHVNLPGLGDISWDEQTNYPWDGAISLVCTEQNTRPYAMNMRIPEWAVGATVKLNGKALAPVQPGRYFTIRRAWMKGDRIELLLPMQVRLLQADRRVEQDLNQLAVARGPLVYCLESVDAGGVDRLDQLKLDRKQPLTASFQKDLLGGITVIQTRMVRAASPADKGLYSSAPSQQPAPVAVRFVPYFLWNNRGVGEMTVWMPVSN